MTFTMVLYGVQRIRAVLFQDALYFGRGRPVTPVSGITV